jgi:excinuclease ABC A subunit
VRDTSHIRIVGARENNLRDVSLALRKRQLIVFTGVSGSGKSSLVFDTIAAESQRQLNETFPAFARHRLPQHGKPDVDALENLTAAIVIDQKRLGGGPRSTVGTVSDAGPMLRLLFSRIGKPFVGYSNVFSFNNPEGMCPRCEGLGAIHEIDPERLVDRGKSLNEGALRFSMFRPGTVRWKRYVTSGLFDNDKKLRDYSDAEWQLLMFAQDMKLKNPPPAYPRSGDYEGVLPKFRRLFVQVEGESRYADEVAEFAAHVRCPACHGQRLNDKILSCRIDGRSIADAGEMTIKALRAFVQALPESLVAVLCAALAAQLQAMEDIGLGYLTLSRPTSSLSGGESQRLKMVRHLGSSLVDMTYVFDEPSTGLHPSDVHQVNALLAKLRDNGNTVLVVEHDPDVIAVADEVVDMGPGAGRHGGAVVFQGSVDALLGSHGLTGRLLAKPRAIKPHPRTPSHWIDVEGASLHNLKRVSTRFPVGVLTAVTGVAGSGKSSLVHGALAPAMKDLVRIDQGALRGSRRSTVATYSGLMDAVRAQFAAAAGVDAALFSQHGKGACPACKGTGVVVMDLAFMDAVEWPCDTCEGSGFNPQALDYTWKGRTIAQVMALSVEQAAEELSDPQPRAILQRLADVGLAYMALGQSLDTLSGGERQRLKLAAELEREAGTVVLDEPTTGLHMADVDKLLQLLNRMVDAGKTLIVIEHNLEVVAQADWVIDLGPGAGEAGGKIVYEGPVPGLLTARASLTGKFLKQYLERPSAPRPA